MRNKTSSAPLLLAFQWFEVTEQQSALAVAHDFKGEPSPTVILPLQEAKTSSRYEANSEAPGSRLQRYRKQPPKRYAAIENGSA